MPQSARQLLADRPIGTELRVVGMRRTGNHAVISWLLGMAGERRVFVNNTLPEDPYALEADANYTKLEGDGAVDLCICSFEDRLLTVLGDPARNSSARRQGVDADRRVTVVILRDPLNLFASRAASSFIPLHRTSKFTMLTSAGLLDHYVREALGRTNHVPGPKVFIEFGRWATSEEYRREVAERLGLGHSDAGMREVMAYGMGSSFEGKKASFTDDASRRRLADRWLTYKDDKDFRRALAYSPFIDNTLAYFDLSAEQTDYLEMLKRDECSAARDFVHRVRLAACPGLARRVRQVRTAARMPTRDSGR